MPEPLPYANPNFELRLSKLALFSLGIGALLLPAVHLGAFYMQDHVNFGNSVSHAQAQWWGVVGALPGILGMTLATIALFRVARNPSRLRGIALTLIGLFSATLAASWGAWLLMLISLQDS